MCDLFKIRFRDLANLKKRLHSRIRGNMAFMPLLNTLLMVSLEMHGTLTAA